MNKIKMRKKWQSDLCQDKQDWSAKNQACHLINRLFLFNEREQQPFMLMIEDGVHDAWQGRSLNENDKITSGENGNIFFALCAPHAVDVKLTTMILTGKPAGAQQQCPTTTTTAITTTTAAITSTATAVPTTTTPTTTTQRRYKL